MTTAFAAGFTGYQAWIARDTEERQLRAYIVEDGADLRGFRVGSKSQVEVLFANLGQTPAHEAVWMSQLDVLDYAVGQTFSHLDCRMAMDAPDNPKWILGNPRHLLKTGQLLLR